jgi:hypothetical protein
MAGKPHAKRIAKALEGLEAARTDVDRLDAARRLREGADELERAAVETARAAGMTWSEIGAVYGLTKQGAQQRFR